MEEAAGGTDGGKLDDVKRAETTGNAAVDK